MVITDGLNSRRLEPELMDQPGLDERQHRQALGALQRVNTISGTVRRLWRQIVVLRRSSPLRILDLASGAGDIALGLAQAAHRAGIAVEIEGCDVSPTAINYAREMVERRGLRNIRFVTRDVLREPLPADYDVVTCTLFLHHLAEDDAIAVLRRMAAATKGLVLVDDLRRTRLGYALSWLGTRLLTRSPIVRTDGLLSVSAAFTIVEVAALAQAAGLTDASIVRHWPQRYLLSWSRK